MDRTYTAVERNRKRERRRREGSSREEEGWKRRPQTNNERKGVGVRAVVAEDVAVVTPLLVERAAMLL
jgi:hypothetical protein